LQSAQHLNDELRVPFNDEHMKAFTNGYIEACFQSLKFNGIVVFNSNELGIDSKDVSLTVSESTSKASRAWVAFGGSIKI
jgi:hypothetical protein